MELELGATGLRQGPGIEVGGHDGGGLVHVVGMSLEAGQDDGHDVVPVGLPLDDGAVGAALLARHKGDGEVGRVLCIARGCVRQHGTGRNLHLISAHSKNNYRNSCRYSCTV